MFTHDEKVCCNGRRLEALHGPVMTEELTLVYPCNRGMCAIDCTCELCENTRTNVCPLKEHKKHISKFDIKCPVQIASQCQDHWVSHPANFNMEEDIFVEKNVFFHNNQLIEQPRNYALDILRFAGIKKD